MRRRRLPSPTLAASRALLWRTRFGNDTELIAVKLVVGDPRGGGGHGLGGAAVAAFALTVLVGNAFQGRRVAGGVVIRDDAGRLLRLAARTLGEVSPHEAAYRMVLTGQWQAKDLEVNRIEVLVNDPHVAAQLGGDAAVPSSLVGLFLQVRAYRWSAVTSATSLRIAEAEGVARQALDRNVDGVDLDARPVWIAFDRVWVT